MGNYKTVFQAAIIEENIEKSRFIGYVLPIENEADATRFIAEVRKKHWDATHNVPVYVVGEQFSVQKYSDDGEPSGTAGLPILDMLKKEGVTNVCIVITRYFGGVKLGTGGLVRAYTHTAKSALEKARIIERKGFKHVGIVVDYSLHGKIQNYIVHEERIIGGETLFSEVVEIQVYFEPQFEQEITKAILDLTSGQMEWKSFEDVILTV